MEPTTDPGQPSHWLLRLFYGVTALFCLLLGVVGLVLPIIPGIVFLALGALLLKKASSRLAQRLPASLPRHDGHYFQAGRSLSPIDRLCLGGWLLARGMMNAIQGLSRAVSGRSGF